MNHYIFVFLLFFSSLPMVCADEVVCTFHPTTGDSYSAKLDGFEGKNACFTVNGESRKIPVEELRLLEFQSLTQTHPETQDFSSVWKISVADSEFQVTSLTLQQKEFKFQSLFEGSVDSLKQGTVRQILMKEVELQQNKDLEADWKEIQHEEMTGDQLVVLREGKLNSYFGTVLEITEKAVRFEQDGETLNIKLKHVFAIRFMQVVESEEAENLPKVPFLGILTDLAGSRYMISTLTPSEGKIQFTTTDGIHAEIPVSALQTLDFLSDRTIHLTDLEPESVKHSMFFDLESSEKLAGDESLQTFHAPQFIRASQGKNILLGEKNYDSALVLTSQTQIVFRLPGSFQKFNTIIGIADSVRPGGNAEVTILADERVLFHETVTGKEEPKPIEFQMENVRRLTFLVDFGESGGFSDRVVFGIPQLVK